MLDQALMSILTWPTSLLLGTANGSPDLGANSLGVRHPSLPLGPICPHTFLSEASFPGKLRIPGLPWALLVFSPSLWLPLDHKSRRI